MQSLLENYRLGRISRSPRALFPHTTTSTSWSNPLIAWPIPKTLSFRGERHHSQLLTQFLRIVHCSSRDTVQWFVKHPEAILPWRITRYNNNPCKSRRSTTHTHSATLIPHITRLLFLRVWSKFHRPNQFLFVVMDTHIFFHFPSPWFSVRTHTCSSAARPRYLSLGMLHSPHAFDIPRECGCMIFDCAILAYIGGGGGGIECCVSGWWIIRFWTWAWWWRRW